MNKTQLIHIVANKTGLSKTQTQLALSSILVTITESLKKGDAVQLVGFGTFKRNYRKERSGRNPKTGQKIKISASHVPVFVSGKRLKDTIQ